MCKDLDQCKQIIQCSFSLKRLHQPVLQVLQTTIASRAHHETKRFICYSCACEIRVLVFFTLTISKTQKRLNCVRSSLKFFLGILQQAFANSFSSTPLNVEINYNNYRSNPEEQLIKSFKLYFKQVYCKAALQTILTTVGSNFEGDRLIGDGEREILLFFISDKKLPSVLELP